MRVWDLRAPGCPREYGSRAAVNTVVLHPNQVGSCFLSLNEVIAAASLVQVFPAVALIWQSL